MTWKADTFMQDTCSFFPVVSHTLYVMSFRPSIVLSLVFLLSFTLALTHPFTFTLQKFSDSTKLADCWICARTNNAHNEPELVAWPLYLEGRQNLSNKDVGFSFDGNEIFL